MLTRIHIIIVEPSAILRCGVVSLLQRESKYSCDIAEVSSFSSLTSRTSSQTPDLLIINPSYLGQFSLTELKSNLGNENLKIIALQNSFVDPTQLQNYDEVISLYDSIETVSKKIFSTIQSEEEETENKKELSAREKEIIVCVVKGMTNKQIAETLYLSAHTVIAHRRNIANKLQIHSPSGLTIYAIVNKLVDLADIKHGE
ncbi:MAG: LuxR C-terminal-related transcriptional regulator [Rikenellaceae bacterium]